MTPSSSEPQTPVSRARQFRNLLIVGVAVILSVLLTLGLQNQSARPTLTTLAASATALDTAIANGKPSLVEFYANWCTSCQAMVDDMTALEAEYKDRVNFVMLNVDNSKWLPELMRYRVDGIPHFVFLDRQGGAIAGVVGEQPRTILDNNLAALVADAELPYQKSSGQTSAFSPNIGGSIGDDPRAHGSSTAGT
ncbi:thioredoxin family protein [Altericista sp. CCNU0014]|uniref:thioredoxin family protein n=1 Tax=Altericista sp. CCNU0014 TaxID=3082949 RepID=UPI00384D255C